MKIAVLYIATGKYIVFWKDFFTSSEKFFIPGSTKEYFVFTDATEFEFSNNPQVHTISHQKLGWPYDTLLRFQVFLKAKEQLVNCDYIFFFNANMQFVQTITAAEFLPDGKTDDGLVATLHPRFFNKPREKFTYEDQQTTSLAYVDKSKGKNYFMGGLNGGTCKAYMKLIEELDKNIQLDLEKNVIARWHDESHLNHYMIDKNPKILSPAYGYPQGKDLPFKPKIIIRDKNRYGGHDFLRGDNVNRPILRSIKQIFKTLLGK